MNAVSLLASYLVNAVWQVAIIAAAGWLAALALKRLGPRAEHVGWVATLGIAVLTPAVPFFQFLYELSHPQYAAGKISLALTASGETAGEIGSYQWPALVIWGLAALYFATVLYFAGRIVWSFCRVRVLIRDAVPVPLTPQQQEIWSYCQRSFGLKDARLLSSETISGPVVAGLRRPVLIVPGGFIARCSEPDLLGALAHECAHARRHDFQKNLFYEAICLALSFHPAIWMIKARIAQSREMICDSMVAERVLEAHTYAQSLLRLAAMIAISPQATSAHAIGIFDANILEKRIMTMSSKKRYIGRVLRCCMIALAAVLLVSTGMITATKAVAIQAQSAPAANQSDQSATNAAPYGPVYKVGKDVSLPVPIHEVDAEFPKSGRSLKKSFQAIVLVRMIVDKEGTPRDVRIARSYNPDFDAEAIKAVKQYRFKPAERAGEPVAVTVNIEVNFRKY